jgi:hypothetical protein
MKLGGCAGLILGGVCITITIAAPTTYVYPLHCHTLSDFATAVWCLPLRRSPHAPVNILPLARRTRSTVSCTAPSATHTRARAHVHTHADVLDVPTHEAPPLAVVPRDFLGQIEKSPC